jgi:ATP-dependent Clp protease, protease subunit
MRTIKRGSFIPVNDVPNLEDLLNGGPVKTKDAKVTESCVDCGDVTVNNNPAPDNQPTVNPQHMISQIDSVWGFMFFDFPTVYTDGNTIHFDGEISKDSVDMLKQTIIATGQTVLTQYHELGIHDPNDMRIELRISSPGGAISAGWDLIDFMNNFYIPINTVGTGTVASMGVMVLLAGKKRYLTKNTHMLVHQFRAGVQGKRQDILDYMKHFEDIQNQIVKFLVAHTKLSETRIIDMLQHETWMTADQSLTDGFVDALI